MTKQQNDEMRRFILPVSPRRRNANPNPYQQLTLNFYKIYKSAINKTDKNPLSPRHRISIQFRTKIIH